MAKTTKLDAQAPGHFAAGFSVYNEARVPSTLPMRVLILGCGYLGVRVGELLRASGHEVWGTRRSPESATELESVGIRPVIFDFGVPESLKQLPDGVEWIVHCASTGRGGADAYRLVFDQGLRMVELWMRNQPLQKFVFTSSTSVYGQVDGSWVDEDSPVSPEPEGARILVQAELHARSLQGLGAVVLRLAGLYGAGRGHLLQQLLRREARVEGTGQRWLNMVHREDAARAVVLALEQAPRGEVYNVADNEPVAQVEFLRWLADKTGNPMPQRAEPASGSPRTKRARTHKRVSNRKLRETLGWVLRYPSYREGYREEIRKRNDEPG